MSANNSVSKNWYYMPSMVIPFARNHQQRLGYIIAVEDYNCLFYNS